MNQAFYRKYRPKNFNELKGQEIVNKILINAIVNNRIVHAYLFHGPRGTGKTSTAKLFARALNCENPINGSPCEHCNSCIVSKEINVDIIEMDAASNNGVDEIRDLKERVEIVPSQLKFKVYIIDEVQMLTNSAYNALLKTLEEPPKHVIFIFATTEIVKIPDTVLSRCQILEFDRLTQDAIVENLKEIAQKENMNIEIDALKRIAYISNGGMRDALGILDKTFSFKGKDKITEMDINEITGMVSLDKVKEIYELITANDYKSAIKLVHNLSNQGNDLESIVKDLVFYMSNMPFDETDYTLLGELNDTLNKMKISEIVEIPLVVYLASKISTKKKLVSILRKVENIESLKQEKVSKKIKGIQSNDYYQELKKVRVNNCFVNASKEIKNKIINEMDKILTYDPSNGERIFVEILGDSNLEMACNEILVFTHKNTALINQANINIEEVEKIIKKIFKHDYKLIFITQKEWKDETEQYFENIKNKVQYIIKEEPIKIINNEETDELVGQIKEFFGQDKVEVK